MHWLMWSIRQCKVQDIYARPECSDPDMYQYDPARQEFEFIVLLIVNIRVIVKRNLSEDRSVTMRSRRRTCFAV